MNSRLKDRVCVVTGAARGIGLAIAERFGREGGRIACVDVSARRLEPAVEELKNSVRERLTAGNRKRPDRVDVILQFRQQARSVVGESRPIRFRARADQRQLANPSRRIGWPLDLARMGREASHIEGAHDFAAFRSASDPRHDTVRTMTRAVECFGMFSMSFQAT